MLLPVLRFLQARSALLLPLLQRSNVGQALVAPRGLRSDQLLQPIMPSLCSESRRPDCRTIPATSTRGKRADTQHDTITRAA